MRSSPGSRGGLVFALALAGTFAAAACSKTPHFVPDQTGGNGGSGVTTTSTGSTSSSTSTSSGNGGAGPRPCIGTADCGMVDTECAHPTCEQGQCGVQLEPMGTVIEWQVPFDCKKNVCDGAGHAVPTSDDTDVPSDGNPCTDDTCLNGEPKHGFVAAGVHCGQKPALACDGAGTCAGCTNDSQCGAPGVCFTWKCDLAQTCQQVFVPMGSGSPGGGTTGDCQRNVCDGTGGTVTIADPGDLPADPSTCTLGACVGNVPTATPAEAGIACFGGQCDGMGNCGTCSSDGDCGDPSACATPKCVGGHCSAIFAPAGTATPQQTPDDCKTNVCDGAGHVTSAPDDADVPPDPDACTISGCSGGSPTTTPVNVPSSGNACIQDGCDPQSGVFHDPLPNNTPCGGCSICQSTVCTDPCPALGCQCLGTACGICF